jgi:hypothetical protein
LLEYNWTVGILNSIDRTGESKYIIAVVSSEFVVLPLDYSLTITDITIDVTTTSSTATTSDTILISTVTETTTETTAATTGVSGTSTGTVPLNWYAILFAIIVLPIIKKRR